MREAVHAEAAEGHRGLLIAAELLLVELVGVLDDRLVGVELAELGED